MKDRVNALEGRDRDWDAYEGEVLSITDDPALQAIVKELSAELEVPIALVSLVLQRTQLFRAQVGLSGELERLRATDRDVSFCQFVVRDGVRFEVNDAQVDDRVPQTLVRTHNIRAYLGFPVKVGDAVVGSLCGIDTRAREFSPRQKNRLEALATRVSARLGELARLRARVPLQALSGAMQPALAELRNVLSPLVAGVPAARVAAEELKVALRAQGALPEWASKAGAAVDDLGEVLGEMSSAAERVRPLMNAVQRTVGDASRATSAAEAVALSLEIAAHHLRPVGGVTAGEIPAILLQAPVGVAVCAVAGLLSALGLALVRAGARSGVALAAARVERGVALSITAPVSSAEARRCVDEVAQFLPDAGLEAVALDGRIELTFATR